MRIVADRLSTRHFEQAVEQLARACADSEAMLQDVASAAAYPAILDVFDNEGYGAWAGLAPAYALKKLKEVGDQPLLQRSGTLKQSLTLEGAPGNVHQFSEDGTLAIGSDLPYFGVQNDSRPIAQFQGPDLVRMKAVATDYVAQSGVKAGFEVSTI